MTLAACILVLLIKASIAESSNILDYPLSVIEYLQDQHVGTFECIFSDTSSQNPYGDVLSDLLQSSELEYVFKYVTQGFYKSDLLSKDPALLVLDSGRDDDLRSKGVVSNFLHFLNRFNPATTVFVFLDFSESYATSLMRFVFVNLNMYSVLFFSTKDSAVIANSLTDYAVVVDDLPHPKYFFDWFKQELRGKNISYVREPRSGNQNPNYKWFVATAEYLKGEAHEFHKREGGPNAADVQLETRIAYGVPDHFQDFNRYGLKFRYNLNEFPEVIDHPVIGSYIDNGEHIEIWENIPGFAKYVTQQMADLVPRFSYDFERDQSWFVVLDESFFVDAILVHLTAFRSQYVNTFHFTEMTLNEAGILSYWWRQSGHSYWLGAWGIRPKGRLGDESFLIFEDMLLAWIILGIGGGISMVAFISEITMKKKLFK